MSDIIAQGLRTLRLLLQGYGVSTATAAPARLTLSDAAIGDLALTDGAVGALILSDTSVAA